MSKTLARRSGQPLRPILAKAVDLAEAQTNRETSPPRKGGVRGGLGRRGLDGLFGAWGHISPAIARNPPRPLPFREGGHLKQIIPLAGIDVGLAHLDPMFT